MHRNPRPVVGFLTLTPVSRKYLRHPLEYIPHKMFKGNKLNLPVTGLLQMQHRDEYSVIVQTHTEGQRFSLIEVTPFPGPRRVLRPHPVRGLRVTHVETRVRDATSNY